MLDERLSGQEQPAQDHTEHDCRRDRKRVNETLVTALNPADHGIWCLAVEVERLDQYVFVAAKRPGSLLTGLIGTSLEASRVLIVCGASGTGKTSLLQAGLLPSLPTEQYAWSRVRMVDDEPTMAIKAALTRDFALDQQLLAQPLLTVVRTASATLDKTVVLILDQFEEFFQRHARKMELDFDCAA